MKLMVTKFVHERGSFLRDVVFAASDGLVTTFAVVAGSQGAAFAPKIVVIMGFANLLADGVSMSSGTYLGIKSEVDYEKAEGGTSDSEVSPIKHALVTFAAFDLAGLVPLLPYVTGMENQFYVSVVFVILVLFLIGTLRGKFTKKHWYVSSLEMLLVGGLAAVVAYLTGDWIETFTR